MNTVREKTQIIDVSNYKRRKFYGSLDILRIRNYELLGYILEDTPFAFSLRSIS